MRRIVIDVTSELPLRATRLADTTLARVFGGCVPKGNRCVPLGGAFLCCPGSVCRSLGFAVPGGTCQ